MRFCRNSAYGVHFECHSPMPIAPASCNFLILSECVAFLRSTCSFDKSHEPFVVTDVVAVFVGGLWFVLVLIVAAAAHNCRNRTRGRHWWSLPWRRWLVDRSSKARCRSLPCERISSSSFWPLRVWCAVGNGAAVLLPPYICLRHQRTRRRCALEDHPRISNI